jgi:hypothetical protein
MVTEDPVSLKISSLVPLGCASMPLIVGLAVVISLTNDEVTPKEFSVAAGAISC